VLSLRHEYSTTKRAALAGVADIATAARTVAKPMARIEPSCSTGHRRFVQYQNQLAVRADAGNVIRRAFS
jgi:hypothetical protein